MILYGRQTRVTAAFGKQLQVDDEIGGNNMIKILLFLLFYVNRAAGIMNLVKYAFLLVIISSDIQGEQILKYISQDS